MCSISSQRYASSTPCKATLPGSPVVNHCVFAGWLSPYAFVTVFAGLGG
jgi:hypothetical protein